MTCIVGIVDKGNVYMGGDSAGVSGLSVSVRADEKVFSNGPFIMGFTTSFRMGQILRYKFDPPRQTVGVDDMKYMVTDFVDAVRKCFGENGFGSTNDKSPNAGGTFLVGYNGKLYTVDSDFQVGIPADNYDAVGCGTDLALGALYATAGKKPLDRIRIALEAASKFSGGVLPPFVTLHQSKK
jgi:ATP-dependent protease HslVU (ClpYQ) peptidase subunit